MTEERLPENDQACGKVNKQDFLQVFQGSGIGKIEDNLTSADLLSYTTNGSRRDLGRKKDYLKMIKPDTNKSIYRVECDMDTGTCRVVLG